MNDFWSFLVIFLIGYVVYKMFKDDSKSKSQQKRKKKKDPFVADYTTDIPRTKMPSMIKHERIKQEIPSHYCQFPDDIEDFTCDFNMLVKGVHYRKANVIKWASGSNPRLEAKREPNNKHDKNAIAIYGVSGNGRFHIGYMDAELAQMLVEAGLDKDIVLTLDRAEITDNVDDNSNFDMKIFIEYSIYVPCVLLRKSREYFEEEGCL